MINIDLQKQKKTSINWAEPLIFVFLSFLMNRHRLHHSLSHGDEECHEFLLMRGSTSLVGVSNDFHVLLDHRSFGTLHTPEVIVLLGQLHLHMFGIWIDLSEIPMCYLSLFCSFFIWAKFNVNSDHWPANQPKMV